MRRTLVFLAFLGFALALPVDDNRRFAGHTYSGYTTVVDVNDMASLEVDQIAIDTAVGINDFTAAKKIYQDGQILVGKRTMRELSTSLGDKVDALEIKMKSANTISIIQAYANYWSANPIDSTNVKCQTGKVVTTGCPNYADVNIMSAFDSDGTNSNIGKTGRGQTAKKFMTYGISWLYTVRQLSEAIYLAEKTTSGSTVSADAKNQVVTAIDSAWAYFAGSKGTNTAELLSRKRGVEFGVCATVSSAILSKFKELQTEAKALTAGGSKIRSLAQDAVPLMTIPLVQGCVRYAYVASGMVNKGATGNSEAEDAAIGELWSFCAQILPQLRKEDAEIVRKQIDPKLNKGLAINGPVILAALESSYISMGITAAQVGKFNAKVTEADNAACASSVSKTSSASSTSVSTFVAMAAALLSVFATMHH